MSQHPDFETIYNEHSDMVFNLCYQLLNNQEDAEEVYQDVFLKVNEALDDFRKEAHIKTWIYRITSNACIDRIRKNKRRFKLFQQVSYQTVQQRSHDLNPEESLESREQQEEIHHILDLLPAKQKIALVLKSVEGLTQQEIAKSMNMNEKAVESLLSRARKKLKHLLALSEG